MHVLYSEGRSLSSDWCPIIVRTVALNSVASSVLLPLCIALSGWMSLNAWQDGDIDID